MAGNMAKQTDRAEEPNKDWYYGFIKRFPALSVQKPKKREISRVKSTNEVNMKNFSRTGENFDQVWLGLNFISLYKLQAETYNTHYDNNTEHLHNRDSEESQNDFCNPSPR